VILSTRRAQRVLGIALDGIPSRWVSDQTADHVSGRIPSSM
jgi:hypothetical protein